METESVKPARRTYSREYKIEAVKLTTQGGLTVAQAARDLGLNDNTLHKWRKQFQADSEHAFPGKRIVGCAGRTLSCGRSGTS